MDVPDKILSALRYLIRFFMKTLTMRQKGNKRDEQYYYHQP